MSFYDAIKMNGMSAGGTLILTTRTLDDLDAELFRADPDRDHRARLLVEADGVTLIGLVSVGHNVEVLGDVTVALSGKKMRIVEGPE